MEKLKRQLAEAEAALEARKKPPEDAGPRIIGEGLVIDEWVNSYLTLYFHCFTLSYQFYLELVKSQAKLCYFRFIYLMAFRLVGFGFFLLHISVVKLDSVPFTELPFSKKKKMSSGRLRFAPTW